LQITFSKVRRVFFMDLQTKLFLLFPLSYILGALPFALIVSRLRGVDLRSEGSGNLGATNVYRVMGWPYALLVFGLDLAKGWLPTWLCLQVTADPFLHIAVGAVAVVGHSFTVFARFRGGKGAATGLGVLLALSPDVWAITIAIAVLVIGITRMVSVGTIICCVSLPFLLWAFGYPLAYVGVVGAVCVMIVLRHRTNIVRLIQGKENKI